MDSSLIYIMGQLVGILIAAGVTMAAIYLVRGPLERFLAALIPDEVVVRLATNFVLLLLGLRGLATILGYISQPELQAVLGALTGLLDGMAADVQWAAQVAALLFIGYAIARRWRGREPDGSVPAGMEWAEMEWAGPEEE